MEPRPLTDPITLQLDRWASLLSNEWQEAVSPDLADQLVDLSTLLTIVANKLSSR